MVLVFRGLQGQGLRFSFLTARGGGTAPVCVLLEIATESLPAPRVWGGWRCRLIEDLLGRRGGPAKP